MKRLTILGFVLTFVTLTTHAARVTHTYADGSTEVYYTDMSCNEVYNWVDAHPEWTNIVSCDPEVMVAPPTGGTISVNSTMVSVESLTDFKQMGSPKGKGGLSSSKCNKSNSLLYKILFAVGGVLLGIILTKLFTRKSVKN